MISEAFKLIEMHITEIYELLTNGKEALANHFDKKCQEFDSIGNEIVLVAKIREYIEYDMESNEFLLKDLIYQCKSKIQTVSNILLVYTSKFGEELSEMIREKIKRDGNSVQCKDNMDLIPEKTGIYYIEIDWNKITDYAIYEGLKGTDASFLSPVDVVSRYTIKSLTDAITSGGLKFDLESYFNYVNILTDSFSRCLVTYINRIGKSINSLLFDISHPSTKYEKGYSIIPSDVEYIKICMKEYCDRIIKLCPPNEYFRQIIIVTRSLISNFELISKALQIYISEDNMQYSI